MYYIIELVFTCCVILLSNSPVKAKLPGIICVSDLEQADPYNYDCSNLSLNWTLLNNLIDATWSATNLNLASNEFGPIVANLSLNQFKLLNNTLNLSSNSLEEIQSHAFYYMVQLNVQSNETGTLVSFPIVKLDLSKNSFTRLPWNSIKSLSNLKELFLSHNNISSLDMGDLLFNTDSNNLSDDLFSSLTHVYLSSCSLKYVSHDILKYLTNLVMLDLSKNQLKSLDPQIGQVLGYNNDRRIFDEQNRPATQLDLHDNPLECNCSLLWLKKYLLKYGKNDAAQTCITRRAIPLSEQIQPSIVRIETVDLGLEQPPNTIDMKEEQIVFADKEKYESIILLDKNRFFCDLEFIDSVNATVVKKIEKKYIVQLTCVVKGFPKPVIRWNQGNKALDKNIDQNFVITESLTSSLNNDIDADYLTEMYMVTSQLELKKSFIKIDERNEYKNYSCTAKFEQSSNENHFQKMVLFKIYRTDTSAQQQQLNSPEKIILPSETKELNKEYLNRKTETYWLILLLCILVALIFILFASICIIRNVVQSYRLEKKIIEKEKAFNGNRNSTYSYTQSGTLGRRHTETYSASTTSTTRNSAMGLLKPDVIRPHHDFASNYNTSSNRTPSTRQSSPNSNMNSFLYSSPVSLLPMKTDDPAELDNLINKNQSYDNHPIDMSLLFDDDEASTSTKSFDENIEQYQEPKFDDLRKPVPKQTIDQK